MNLKLCIKNKLLDYNVHTFDVQWSVFATLATQHPSTDLHLQCSAAAQTP